MYCDNRLTLTDVEVRTDVEEGLARLIREHYPEVEVLMGTSTAGIAHAAITGHLMGLPMGYVRSGAKDHGRQNQIEGKLLPGQKVVVVEDLISTGGSVLEVVNVLREAGAQVLGVVSIFTYGMAKGLKRLAEAQVKHVSLTNFDVIAQVAGRGALYPSTGCCPAHCLPRQPLGRELDWRYKMKRSVINILDLSVEELDELIATANDIIAQSQKVQRKVPGPEAGHPVLRALHPDPAQLRGRHV